ncbi:uroporphyrinogen-III synthase [Nocardioides cavernaquae]|uniref:Uroporphyrinogen-III synthase n=1 Tax=Nocardioides cavernaquae TaxID=2321396 RepID=A0A3A5HEH8_9ACTN|nr:uroporphyrinogen-III synthase [Nocardioides cavernaquae]RJS46297.1 uroporphyrinogen-III synthase [Nocardioides cavernaquae]
MTVSSTDKPLEGYRIGITAARKVDEQVALLERRGAHVEVATTISVEPNRINEVALREATHEVIGGRPVDLFVATTGIGIRSWFEAAASWGLLDQLIEVLGRSEILARGPKSVGALRNSGLRELWSPDSERFEDVLAHLRGRDLTGRRIVVQEHGQSLSTVAHALRRQGADVHVVTVYRLEGAHDPDPVFRMVDLVAERKLDAVTFTSAPAVAAFMDMAGVVGRREEVLAAFQADVVATCVGPVTAAAFEMWGVPTIQPERSRLAAMVKLLETELPSRRDGTALDVSGHTLLMHGDVILLDGIEVRLSPAPLAVLHALAVNPGHVVSRRELLSCLPTGQASSEHAVEMAVARLRAAIGTRLIQTVVKRGYRLVVG